MSHSPALESSPAATTPSTPVLRNLVANERNPSRSPPHSRDDRFLYQPDKVKEYQDRDNNSKRDSHNTSERDRNRDHQSASEKDSKRESINLDGRRDQSSTASERDAPKRDSSHYNLEKESKRDSHSDSNPKKESYSESKSDSHSKRDSHSAQDRERMREHQNLNLEREKYTMHGEGAFGKEDNRHGLVKGSQRLSTGLQVSMAAANAVASFSSTPLHGNFSTDHQWYGVSQQTPPGGAPHSPGAISWGGEAPGATSSDKSSETGAPRLSRKESYKAQRQHYRKEKKRATSALLSSLEDPAVVILADWLKVRGSLKSWTKLWCVLKPGLLLLYKSSKAKSNHWVGTVLLSACQVIERPSKKDGFCFKLYHPLEQSIWAPRGPHNETIGAVVQPLPTAHLIFRAPSQAAGKCWLDGLELALKSSNMLLRCGASEVKIMDATANHETQWSPEDLEKHFHEHDLDGADATESDSEGGGPQPLDEIELDGSVRPLIMASGQRDPSGSQSFKAILDRVVARLNAVYVDELNDDVGQSGEVMEELGEENKSLLWFLVKQVRPGMDLSKVVLPTFILEPRSFLDKLSDSFYHSDILSNAWRHQDPFVRIKTVVTWYLSGLYRKPRGLKKPYNPVLGETFRCCWLHPKTNTRTYYVSEQVSHHPPISAFYVSNRKEGFAIEASILAKSKFYGNSTSAILDGIARVTLLPLGETYLATSPYAHCKGLLVGTLTMELGGRVTITCPQTAHTAEIEFKLKPFIGGSDSINMVSGRIRHNKDTLATIEGHWDGRIDIKDRRTPDESVLLDVAELKGRRLRRQLITPEHLGDFESQRLWQKVSTAIANEDQIAATEEKTLIEEAQRERARGNSGKEWEARYFRKGGPAGHDLHDDHDHQNQWQYINPDLQPWDDSADILEYESDFVIRTLRRQPGSNLLLMPPVGGSIINEAGVIQDVQDIQLLETERSASETDSTNSHHRRTPVVQGQQSVTAALLRMESALREQATELAGVRAVVERLDTPHRQQLRSGALLGHGGNLQQQQQSPWPRTSATILNALVVLFVAYVLQTCGNWLLGR